MRGVKIVYNFSLIFVIFFCLSLKYSALEMSFIYKMREKKLIQRIRVLLFASSFSVYTQNKKHRNYKHLIPQSTRAFPPETLS